MNEFIPFGQLPPISEFFKKRAQHLRERLYNLRADDVLTEERFNQTSAFIRAAILPQPVVFNEPIFSGSLDHIEAGIITRLKGKIRDVMIRQVTLPFSGSKELFGYASNSIKIPCDSVVLMPDSGYLTVKLHTIFFSRYEALNTARHMLRSTLEMVGANNDAVKIWSARTEELITRKLLTYRKECMELYRLNGMLRQEGGA